MREQAECSVTKAAFAPRAEFHGNNSVFKMRDLRPVAIEIH
jgi:hypothetical protein